MNKWLWENEFVDYMRKLRDMFFGSNSVQTAKWEVFNVFLKGYIISYTSKIK